MGKFNSNEVLTNLKIMKQFRFYQMLNPDGPKVFGRNTYQLSLITVMVIVQFLIVFGNSGYFLKMEDTPKDVDVFLNIFCNVFNYLSLWRIIVYIFNVENIWKLFDVARIHFFSSEQCCKHFDILYNHRRAIFRKTNYGFIVFTMAAFQWILTPFLINSITSDHIPNIRIPNVLNMRFPVAVHTYNQNYAIFSVIESTMGFVLIYVTLMTDGFLLSFGWVIIAQYEVLARAFGSFNGVEQDIKQQTEINKDLRSILFDQVQLYSKLKLYYSIVRPIILVYGAMVSCSIIIVTYVFISACLSNELLTIFDLSKIGTTILVLTLHLYLYCSLFDSINDKKESINFEIYSCNWTALDLKLKRLLLFTMQMNNTNQLKLKASPKKIINLQLFANVVMTSYNIVSFMLKTTYKHYE